jgi:hypothetical protein
VNSRAGLDDLQKGKFLTLPGRELQPFDRPDRNQSLYRLRYQLFCQLNVTLEDKHRDYYVCDDYILKEEKLLSICYYSLSTSPSSSSVSFRSVFLVLARRPYTVKSTMQAMPTPCYC